MISPPISPVTVCLLVTALILAFTLSAWAGVGVALGSGLFELYLGASNGAGPQV